MREENRNMLNRASWIVLLMLWLSMACHHGKGLSASPHPAPAPLSSHAPLVSSTSAPPSAPSPDLRRLTESRTHEGHNAEGLVVLREPAPPDVGASPHRKLAGSRAWLTLGEQRFAAEDWKGALACAQAGLAELGSKYASRRALDHTDMKLYIAREQLKSGNLEAAAEIMLRQLKIRTNYYADLHTDEIAE